MKQKSSKYFTKWKMQDDADDDNDGDSDGYNDNNKQRQQ